MDKIFFTELKIETIIGAYRWEQNTKQTLLVDLEFAIDAKQIAEKDDLNYAIDYAQVIEAITHFTQQHHFKLIESLAERLADFLLVKYSLHQIRLQIRKRGVMVNVKEVGVVVERST